MRKTFIISVQLFYVILFFCSCESGNKQSDSGIFSISLENEIEKVKPSGLSEAGSRITYIPLETSENGLLREHLRFIRASNTHFAVFNSRDVFLFDSSGKFITKIGARGGGPGEYSSVHELYFSSNGEKIFLLDSKATCLEYDVAGNFSGSFTMENAQLTRMLPLTENLFVFHQLNIMPDVPVSMLISDSQGNIQKTYENHHKLTSERPMPDSQIRPLYLYDGNVRFKQRGDLADTLFTVTEKELVPYAVFNLGKYAMPIDVSMPAQRMNYDEMLNFIGATGKYYVREMLEDVDNLYILLYDYRMLDANTARYMYGYFNKKSRTAKVIGEQGFENNIDGGLPFFPKFIFDDVLVDYVSAFKLREHVLKSNATEMKRKYGTKWDDLLKLANSLDEEANQVLVMVRK